MSNWTTPTVRMLRAAAALAGFLRATLVTTMPDAPALATSTGPLSQPEGTQTSQAGQVAVSDGDGNLGIRAEARGVELLIRDIAGIAERVFRCER